MGTNNPNAGDVVATVDDIVDVALSTLQAQFTALLGDVKGDVLLLLQELEGFIATAIAENDEEALDDYEVILKGILEINKIKTSKALRASMTAALKATAQFGISMVSGFRLPA